MRIIYPGHTYVLAQLDGAQNQTLQFVQRAPYHEPLEGTTIQEVLRVLIDRVKFLDQEVHWDGNEKVILHLRTALALQEGRHLERLATKGAPIENVGVGDDGHLAISYRKP